MLASVDSCVLVGLEARHVDVQADASTGKVVFKIVGLAATSVQEARERVRSAIRNSQLEFPRQRLTVNLAPAELRKEGSGLDLPITLINLSCPNDDLGVEVPRQDRLTGFTAPSDAEPGGLPASATRVGRDAAEQPHEPAPLVGQRLLAPELSRLQDVEDLVHEPLDAEPQCLGLRPDVPPLLECEVLADNWPSAEAVGQRERVGPVGLDPHLTLRPRHREGVEAVVGEVTHLGERALAEPVPRRQDAAGVRARQELDQADRLVDTLPLTVSRHSPLTRSISDRPHQSIAWKSACASGTELISLRTRAVLTTGSITHTPPSPTRRQNGVLASSAVTGRMRR